MAVKVSRYGPPKMPVVNLAEVRIAIWGAVPALLDELVRRRYGRGRAAVFYTLAMMELRSMWSRDRTLAKKGQQAMAAAKKSARKPARKATKNRVEIKLAMDMPQGVSKTAMRAALRREALIIGGRNIKAQFV